MIFLNIRFLDNPHIAKNSGKPGRFTDHFYEKTSQLVHFSCYMNETWHTNVSLCADL